MSCTLSIVRPGSTKAIDRGSSVSFIQNPRRLASAGGSNTNSMPELAGSVRRFISPYSLVTSSSAISTASWTSMDLAWMVMLPVLKIGAPDGTELGGGAELRGAAGLALGGAVVAAPQPASRKSVPARSRLRIPCNSHAQWTGDRGRQGVPGGAGDRRRRSHGAGSGKPLPHQPRGGTGQPSHG